MDRDDIRVGQIYRWHNSEGDGRFEVISIGGGNIIFKRCDDNTRVARPYSIRTLIESVDSGYSVLDWEPDKWSLSKFRFV